MGLHCCYRRAVKRETTKHFTYYLFFRKVSGSDWRVSCLHITIGHKGLSQLPLSSENVRAASLRLVESQIIPP